MNSNPTMLNKIVLITGATHGIGLITAQSLADLGATTLVVGRNPQKVTRVVDEIRTQTGNPNVSGFVADLSVLAEVRSLAQQVRSQINHLDVLVNNVGAYFTRHETTRDGLEMTFALNHLSGFLLTNLLMDLLKASPSARIVNVSSLAHQGAHLDFNDLQRQRGYSGWKAYAQSKLMNLYFTYELACRLQGSPVTVNALHPGFVATNLGASNGGIFRRMFKLFTKLVAISPKEGAQTSIYLASSPEVEHVSGKYFSKSRIVPSSPASHNEAAARQLWEISARITNLA